MIQSLRQTEEQLCEALGKPLDIDEKVMKTKKRQTSDQRGCFSAR